MRRKSFSLVLLIFIVIAVIFVVIFSISLINGDGNSKKKNKKTNETEVAQTNQTSENILDSSFFDSLESIENSTASNTTVTDNPTTPPENNALTTTDNSVSLNDHTYNLESSAQASAKTESNGRQELQINYTGKNYSIDYGTDNAKSFDDIKNDENIKTTLENSYNITITSGLKQGSVANMNLIICSATTDGKTAYFLVTPLKDNEIAYAKIYNIEDNQSLVSDLSEPLNSVSAIISSIQ